MDREILFRAKRIDTGEWVEGLPSYNAYNGDITEIETRNCGFIEIDPETLCQYIGLVDKDGQKIFEGDIANCLECECYGYIAWNASETGFSFLALLEDGLFEEEHLFDYADDLKVIGNIFDTPKLLEAKEEK